jgi:hypothetical protein
MTKPVSFTTGDVVGALIGMIYPQDVAAAIRSLKETP